MEKNNLGGNVFNGTMNGEISKKVVVLETGNSKILNARIEGSNLVVTLENGESFIIENYLNNQNPIEIVTKNSQGAYSKVNLDGLKTDMTFGKISYDPINNFNNFLIGKQSSFLKLASIGAASVAVAGGIALAVANNNDSKDTAPSKTQLNLLVSEASSLLNNKDTYKNTTVKALEEALLKAQSASNITEIKAAEELIQEAINNLELLDPDDKNQDGISDRLVSDVQAAIEELSLELTKTDVWTKDSLANLDTAMKQASEAKESAELEEALKSLKAAQQGLTGIDPDDKNQDGISDKLVSDVQVAIKELSLELTKTDVWTQDSLANLDTALKQASEAKESAKLEEALNILSEAKKQLAIQQPQISVTNNGLVINTSDQSSLELKIEGLLLEEGKDYFVSQKNGVATVFLVTPYTNGETLSVIVSYDGIKSNPETITFVDTTAPKILDIVHDQKLSKLIISTDTTDVDKIVIKVNGKELDATEYSIDNSSDGVLKVTLPPYKDGEKISMQLFDAAGNFSDEVIRQALGGKDFKDDNNDGVDDDALGALQKLINDAKVLDKESYTQASLLTLNTSITKADNAKSNEEIYRATEELISAISKLQPIDPDDKNQNGISDSLEKALDDKIREALIDPNNPSPYTFDSIELFNSKLDSIKAESNSAKTDEDIKDLIEAIDIAQQQELELKAPEIKLDGTQLIVDVHDSLALKIIVNGQVLVEGEDYDVVRPINKVNQSFVNLKEQYLNKEDIVVKAYLNDKYIESDVVYAPDQTAPAKPKVTYLKDDNMLIVVGESGNQPVIKVNGELLQSPDDYTWEVIDGLYTIYMPSYNSGQMIQVGLKDDSGNESDFVELVASGNPPSNYVLSDDGSRVYGTVEPDTVLWITVNGTVKEVIADSDGGFEYIFDSKLLHEESISISKKINNQIIDEEKIQYIDKINLFKDPVIEEKENGQVIKIEGEAGSSVRIEINGKLIKEIALERDGLYEIDVNELGLKHNDFLKLISLDLGGNEVSKTLTYVLTEAPNTENLKFDQNVFKYNNSLSGLQKIEFNLAGIPEDSTIKSIKIGGKDAFYNFNGSKVIGAIYLDIEDIKSLSNANDMLEVEVTLSNAYGDSQQKFEYIVYPLHPSEVIEQDIAGVVELESNSIEQTALKNKSDVGGGFAGLNFGTSSGGGLISKNPRIDNIVVNKGEVLDLTISISANNLLGGDAFKIYLIKHNSNIVEELEIGTGGASGGILFIPMDGVIESIPSLTEGKYSIEVRPVNGFSVVSFVTLTITDAQVVKYTDSKVKETLFKYEGNVKNELADYKFNKKTLDELEDFEVVRIYFNDTWISLQPGTSKIISGKYGDLNIHSDGKYSYIPKVSHAQDLGKEDQFTLVFSNINNQTEADKVEEFAYKLNAQVQSPQLPSASTIESVLIQGTESDDSLLGNKLNNIIQAGDDSYTLNYQIIADNNTGGNGWDIWTDFAIGNSAADNADAVDLRVLLGDISGQDQAQYINIDWNAGTQTAVISIDRDGASDKYAMTKLLTLQNIQDKNGDLSNVKNGDDLLALLTQHNQILF